MVKPRKEKGFILITVLFLMLLIALTAVSLNIKAGLSARMTANQSAATQTYFGQLAVTEKALWELTKNPWWRTAGSVQPYGEEEFNLGVDKSSVYNDAVIISVDKSGYGALKTSLQYYLSSIEYTGFNSPRHIALDTAGRVYVADTGNHCIRMIDTNGNVTTVAGRCGYSGYYGDGLLATNLLTRLDTPTSVAVDDSGNIYIADTFNCAIRKVDATTKIISRVAGKFPKDCDYSGNGVPATSAKLDNPYGVKVNAGNIYIADYNNNRIRRIDPAGTITTVAGSWSTGYSGDGGPATSASLNGPIDVFVDAGNIFIADLGNNCVRKVDGQTSIIATFAGSCTHAGYSGDGGPAVSALLGAPRGISGDAAGNVYIADRDRHVIRVVSGQDASRKGYIYTLAGTGTAGYNWSGVAMPAGEFQFSNPASVALPPTPGGRLIYVSDWGNDRIRKLTLTTPLEKKLYK